MKKNVKSSDLDIELQLWWKTTMPRSFLVKKVKSDEDRQPNQYRIRDAFEDSVVSLKAATPFTPALQPLSVRISNGNFLFTVKLFLSCSFQKMKMKLLHVISANVWLLTVNFLVTVLVFFFYANTMYIENIKIIFILHISRSLI